MRWDSVVVEDHDSDVIVAVHESDLDRLPYRLVTVSVSMFRRLCDSISWKDFVWVT